MKVIDLLNKIANKKELPKKIKYNNEIYYLAKLKDDDKFCNYYNEITGYSLAFDYRIINILNDEVKILENEEIDIIKEYKTKYTERCIDKEVRDKLNEVIRVVNKMQLENKTKQNIRLDVYDKWHIT